MKKQQKQNGFSLIELVITVTVLTILTLGAMPLVRVSVKRQREQQLRDTFGMQCTGAGLQGGGGGLSGGGAGIAPPPVQSIDPRSKVVISDCTIFGVDNPDHYPPDLDTLVGGVNVMPRGIGPGGAGNLAVDATKVGQLSTKQKVYLRAIPVDPMTGKAEWDMRSSYDPADSNSWGGENVFDIRSKSKETALNGEKYSDW